MLLEDVAAIHVVPLGRSIERHKTGEKKIPNVIEIPYKHDPTVSVTASLKTSSS